MSPNWFWPIVLGVAVMIIIMTVFIVANAR